MSQDPYAASGKPFLSGNHQSVTLLLFGAFLKDTLEICGMAGTEGAPPPGLHQSPANELNGLFADPALGTTAFCASDSVTHRHFIFPIFRQ